MSKAIVLYVSWQVLYYILIVVRKGEKIRKGERTTSFSFMLADFIKNKPDNIVTKLMLAIGDNRMQEIAFMTLNCMFASMYSPAILTQQSYAWSRLSSSTATSG